MMRRCSLLGLTFFALAACDAAPTGGSASPSPAAPAIAQVAAIDNQLTAQSRAFRNANLTKNFGAVFDAQPGGYTRALGAKSGLNQKELRSKFVKRQADGSKKVSLTAMSIDVAATQIKQGRRGLRYAILPTRRALPLSDGKTGIFDGHTIALVEAGRWRFLSLDSATQLKLLQRAYPDLRAEKWPGLRIYKEG